MTEEEWNACGDARPMLDFLRGKASDRKLRLFVCGYFRISEVPADVDEQSRLAVETSERFADGLATVEDLRASKQRAKESRRAGSVAGIHATTATASNLRWAVGQLFGHLKIIPVEHKKAQLMRELWGPLPFRSVILDPAWLTPTVKQLAEAIYEERAFDRMPILGDALEESGCSDVEILTHCRQPGEHVRGCWLVDLVLGKS